MIFSIKEIQLHLLPNKINPTLQTLILIYFSVILQVKKIIKTSNFGKRKKHSSLRCQGTQFKKY